LIEFALVLPLLLILVFGVIDVGKAVNYWNDTTHLANDTARYAAVNNSGDPNWSADKTNPAKKLNTWIKTQAASTELQNGGGSSSIASPGLSVCIWFPNGTFAVGDPVQVVIKAKYNWLQFLIKKFASAQSTLTGKSTMRLEQAYRADNTDAYTTGTTGITNGSGTC
jgi:hypothetical protein